MSAEKGSSKTDTLVKVVLVFFISLLSFSVGTFVGKQVSDSDHRRLALEGEFKGERNVASTDAKAEPEAAADKVSDKEVESLTEEFVNKEKPSAETASEKAVEEQADAKKVEDKKDDKTADAAGYKPYSRSKATTEKAEPVAEKIAKGEPPAEPAKEDRKPSSTLPSVASSAIGKYTVQVGSFAEEAEAKTQAADLKGKGWNAFYFAADVKGHTWYRVSVGLFNNMNSAKDFRAQFLKDSGSKSAIVQKIIQ